MYKSVRSQLLSSIMNFSNLSKTDHQVYREWLEINKGLASAQSVRKIQIFGEDNR